MRGGLRAKHAKTWCSATIGPFQKTSKIGGGNDAGSASLRAVAVYEPVLGVPTNSRGIVEEALLDADKIPGGLMLGGWRGKGLRLPF